MNRFVFGPVPSRRLGQSLGIDLTPSKTCTLDCRYCQLAATNHQTTERQMFNEPSEVMAELHHVLGEIDPPDWITFSGSGEPTLHAGLGLLIKEIKELRVSPTCVITNSTLLGREDVRAELSLADRVLPTLTTVTPSIFGLIHRPLAGFDLPEILGGLRKFCGNFTGIIDLEIFVCPGINDSPNEIQALRRFILGLENLTSIYLNTAVRPPLDAGIHQASPDELAAFKAALALGLPTTTAFDHNPIPRMGVRKPPPTREGILNLLLRHPCSIEQMERVLNLPGGLLQETLADLEKLGKVASKGDLWVLR